MLPLGADEWRLCWRKECRDRDVAPAPRSRFWARLVLQQFARDDAQTAAMRSLLLQENGSWQLTRLSDEAVIDQIAELLGCGSLHIHVPPPAKERPASAAPSQTDGPAPFPLSERRQRVSAAAPRPLAIDPATFSSDLESAAQAATLVAAAAEGKPFCPE